MKLTKARKVIVATLRKGGPHNEATLSSDLPYRYETVKEHVKVLERAGIVERGWDGSEVVLTDTFRRNPEEFGFHT